MAHNAAAIAIVDETLTGLMSHFDSPAARLMLLAIGLQESKFVHRRQINGPARGFWQFERGGGVRGVMTHPVTAPLMRAVCTLRAVPYLEQVVYDRLEFDDTLACATARLLLYSDPRSLPARGNEQAAWDYYIRNWRPGKPHRDAWVKNYATAMAMVPP